MRGMKRNRIPLKSEKKNKTCMINNFLSLYRHAGGMLVTENTVLSFIHGQLFTLSRGAVKFNCTHFVLRTRAVVGYILLYSYGNIYRCARGFTLAAQHY